MKSNKPMGWGSTRAIWVESVCGKYFFDPQERIVRTKEEMNARSNHTFDRITVTDAAGNDVTARVLKQ
jgi:hypothetical protein